MPLFRKSVSSIVAYISKKVDQLHAAAEAHEGDAVYHGKLVDFHNAQVLEANSEAGRARTVAGKLRDLISG